MEDQLLESITYVLPAVVSGIIAYYFFKSYLIDQQSLRKFQLLNDQKKESL